MLHNILKQIDIADSWHADNTYMETPPMGSILQARMLPNVGGDTCFASMIAAYHALSPVMQGFLDGLTATHSLEQMVERTKHVAGASLRDSLSAWSPVSYPVVRVHPENGGKMLNVNANRTQSIDGLRNEESAALLRFRMTSSARVVIGAALFFIAARKLAAGLESAST